MAGRLSGARQSSRFLVAPAAGGELSEHECGDAEMANGARDGPAVLKLRVVVLISAGDGFRGANRSAAEGVGATLWWRACPGRADRGSGATKAHGGPQGRQCRGVDRASSGVDFPACQAGEVSTQFEKTDACPLAGTDRGDTPSVGTCASSTQPSTRLGRVSPRPIFMSIKLRIPAVLYP